MVITEIYILYLNGVLAEYVDINPFVLQILVSEISIRHETRLRSMVVTNRVEISFMKCRKRR